MGEDWNRDYCSKITFEDNGNDTLKMTHEYRKFPWVPIPTYEETVVQAGVNADSYVHGSTIEFNRIFSFSETDKYAIVIFCNSFFDYMNH